MKKLFALKHNLLLINLIIMIASCNEASPGSTSVDVISASPNQLASLPTQQKLISGALDTLWTDSSTFNNLEKKIIFKFFVGKQDSLTLHGWSSDTDVYNPAPDIRLNNGKKSPLLFGEGSYLGNLILRGPERKEIRRLIRKGKMKYVLFAPQDPLRNNGEVSYEIFLTNDDPRKTVAGLIAGISPTNIKTNPSPPKKF